MQLKVFTSTFMQRLQIVKPGESFLVHFLVTLLSNSAPIKFDLKTCFKYVWFTGPSVLKGEDIFRHLEHVLMILQVICCQLKSHSLLLQNGCRDKSQNSFFWQGSRDRSLYFLLQHMRR